MGEYLCFNDNDLIKRVQYFAKEYFYDFPLLIHDIYFGKKSSAHLGLCRPLNGVLNKNIVSQNLDNVENSSEMIDSDIEINGYFVGLCVDETILHEMCHSYNFTMGDYNANHGKLFKEIAEVISKRTKYNIHTTSSDDYLNTLLSCEEYLKKIKKDKSYIMSLRKTMKLWYDNYEDLYVRVIDEINDMYEGVGDALADLYENGNVENKDDLNKCADKIDDILGKNTLWRTWNWS